MPQPFTHDDLYALLQLAGNDALAVQAGGDQAVLDRMRQFMTAQLVEKLPQFDVFVHLSTVPYSFDISSWMNKVKTDTTGKIDACTVTWAGAPGVLPGAAAKFGIGAVVTYFAKATAQPQPAQPDPATNAGGERDGIFNLPPNIAFGVTALVNSAAQQTIEVFVDDNPKPAATFQGAGTQDANLNTQVLNSGKGKVRVVVTANGKPSKIGSRQVDIFKKTYFGLVGSEDGTDGDYNDGIAILNWPLG
ncbi:fucose-binding lectin II [Burkholderia cepacia]|uniref:Fucose-binding lectin II n=1 Tax=Burkholderia cepacia TaxID=292 RepID=A0A2S8INM3_BURCE|nr:MULTISPECIES: fucose-binding lectin II [Burkholderia]EKS9883792.1 fucose-binding lectin II [Burkholderia pyrrocinia]EKS9893466.1 fucose-binding lectin II [Burkholderia pyrrocinia]EKS9905640.1 fucose-binding lectin II [Burkholderia pyrrocinia]KFL53424.1 fucose-binding lectin II [Burkholderia pyrrocinia]PQP16367.1 fucose-binding lectin II [Burkholderia cepacia]